MNPVNRSFLNCPLHYQKLAQFQRSGTLLLDNTQLKNINYSIQPFNLHFLFFQYQKYPALKLECQYSVQLQCQKCLANFQQLQTIQFKGIFIQDNTESSYNEIVQLGFEPIVVIKEFYLLDLVEEDINLNIPYFPKCKSHQNIENLDIDNIVKNKKVHKPFADLKNLISNTNE